MLAAPVDPARGAGFCGSGIFAGGAVVAAATALRAAGAAAAASRFGRGGGGEGGGGGGAVIVTVKVDSTPSYTKPVALGASLLLPGAGHHFINRDKSALVYITADLLSLSAFLLFNHYASNTMQQAVGYAGQHSGAQGAVTDEEHWTLVGNFLGSDDYNNAIDLNRESASKKITSAASSWYWDDISSQKQFNTMRDQSRSYGVISSFFL